MSEQPAEPKSDMATLQPRALPSLPQFKTLQRVCQWPLRLRVRAFGEHGGIPHVFIYGAMEAP
jgi:hypothetical protein